MAEHSQPANKKLKVCVQAPLTTFFKKESAKQCATITESDGQHKNDEPVQNDQQPEFHSKDTSSFSSSSSVAVPAKKIDGRSFQKHWIAEFPWLQYDSNQDCVKCSICTWAIENNRVGAAVKAILQGQSKSWITGFCDWRKGKAAFRKHNDSNCHAACANAKIASQPENSGIARIVSENTQTKLKENRVALEAIFQCILYLGRQGLAFRGHDDEMSNMKQLLILLGKQSPVVESWLKRNGQYKWISPTYQNEMLKMLSHEILRGIISDVKSAIFFSVILDETTDTDNKEQVSLCVRYVTTSWEVVEDFLGFHQSSKTDSETLFKLLKDSLLSLDLDIKNCRGQCYDGAANMSGRISGLQTRVRNFYPNVLYVYCVGHQLNLVVQELFQELPEGQHAFDTMSSVIKFIRDSPKRSDSFQLSQLKENSSQQKLRPLCPTRWILRLSAIQVFLENYESILNWLENMMNDLDVSGRGKARAFLGSLENFSVYFMLRLFQRVLLTVNPVHQKLQSPSISVGECRLLLERVVDVLSADAASEENFEAFFKSAKEFAAKIGLQEAEDSLPRGHGRRTRNWEKEQEEMSTTNLTCLHFKNLYRSVMSTASKAIIERYPAEDLKVITDIENILLNYCTSNTEKFQTFIMNVCTLYEKDLNKQQLENELEKFCAYKNIKNLNLSTIGDLLQSFRNDGTLAVLLPNIATLLKLYCTLPCTTCSAERSFSSLRRVKSYLRTSMTQQRLNHCSILSIHKDKADSINLNKVINDWIDRVAVRENTFAKRVN